MKRGGSTLEHGFRAEACQVFDIMHTWEKADRSIVGVMQCEPPPLLSHPDGTPTDKDKSNAQAIHWMCDFFSWYGLSCWFGVRNAPPGEGRV